jgi:hypothetical protein
MRPECDDRLDRPGGGRGGGAFSSCKRVQAVYQDAQRTLPSLAHSLWNTVHASRPDQVVVLSEGQVLAVSRASLGLRTAPAPGAPARRPCQAPLPGAAIRKPREETCRKRECAVKMGAA